MDKKNIYLFKILPQVIVGSIFLVYRKKIEKKKDNVNKQRIKLYKLKME